jgi:hypothetical protein
VDAAPSDRERYVAQAKEFRPTDLNAMLSLLLETRGLLRRAEAPRILLEVALVELCTLPTAARIEDLIQRLSDLESRLGPVGGTAAGRSGAGAAPGSTAPVGEPRRSTAPPPRASAEQDPPRAALAAVPAVAPAPAEQAVASSAIAPALRLVESPASVEAANQADPVVRWRQAVDRVKERKLLLGTCLEEGFFLGMAGGNVRIALSGEHAFHRAMLELKENRDILNEELERLYGRGAKLLCESMAPSSADSIATARAGKRPDAVPEATLVDRIVELFDGEVLGPGPEGEKV